MFTMACFSELLKDYIYRAFSSNLIWCLNTLINTFPQLVQSLVLVFAHLVHTQMGAVLDFLSGVPGPTGQSALAFVLTEWCSRQTVFFGTYENKVR